MFCNTKVKKETIGKSIKTHINNSYINIPYMSLRMGFKGAGRIGVKTTREPGAGWEKV